MPKLICARFIFLCLACAFPRSPAAADPLAETNSVPAAIHWTTTQDHQNMMEQLGIRRLRPGPSGQAGATNAANTDPAKANPYPQLPALLLAKNGQPITSAAQWWQLRRPEIVEDFEREVVGRIPRSVPAVSWSVVSNVTGGLVGSWPAHGKKLVGRVDNAACPSIQVEIRMTVVTPTTATHPVPLLMMFGGFGGDGMPRAADAPIPTNRFPEFGGPFKDPPSTEQLLAAGWGYAILNPASIQADNGAGLTQGIIGLVNKGQPRRPDDWGALRAWSWGAARGLDYLETDGAIDAQRVGIEGVSRFGKAALVTMAFEPRFAVALIGSSGEGGAKLHRRNFGEAVENLTGSGEYHWMAGNFLKYGAAEATFGSMNAGDLPVDSHMLIALCAPRSTFISYGIPERGDAHWLDQHGSYMAVVAAGPAFRLLGVPDVGDASDYLSAVLPPVNSGRLDGALAWRQHDGGHEDRSNMKHFLVWANQRLKLASSMPPISRGTKTERTRPPADLPVPRTDSNSQRAHAQLLNKARQGGIDIYFLGDSITRRWGTSDAAYHALLGNWQSNFFGWNAANFGWGADRVENIHWRVQNGELDGVHPKVIILLAGTNNLDSEPAGEGPATEITEGLRALVQTCRAKAPSATIILMGVFLRNDIMSTVPTIRQINRNLASLADGRHVRFLDINDRIADASGRLLAGMMNSDQLHPALPAYQVWADALKPILTEILGPRATTDHAPPPTGDPSLAP